jgi:hypothetical protein
MLEIIPYNLDGNRYEFIASLCLWMFFDVLTRNFATGGDEQIFHITKGM